MIVVVHFSFGIPQGEIVHRLLGFRRDETQGKLANTHIELDLQLVMKVLIKRRIAELFLVLFIECILRRCKHDTLVAVRPSVQFAIPGSRPVISASLSAKNGGSNQVFPRTKLYSFPTYGWIAGTICMADEP